MALFNLVMKVKFVLLIKTRRMVGMKSIRLQQFKGNNMAKFNFFDQAERLLNEELKYYPANEILTIIKKDSVIAFTDTMPQRY